MARIRTLLDAGREAEAAAEARLAIEEARAAHDPPTLAYARLLLGRASRSETTLREALAGLVDAGDLTGEIDARVALAELLLPRGGPARDEAIVQLEFASSRAAQIQGHVARGRIEARLHHQRAQALRADGRVEDAFRAERQASLALTLVPDDELPRLRYDVAAALAYDRLARGETEAAFDDHADAAWWAARMGFVRGEISAIRGQARCLRALGRERAAADQLDRAFALALALDDPHLVAALAHEEIDVLDALGERDSPRRDVLERHRWP